MPDAPRTYFPGLTLWVCFGKWGTPRAFRDGPAFRLCLGFVSFGIVPRDAERVAAEVNDKVDRLIELANRPNS